MKPHTANLINATLLMSLGLWGYLGSDTPSVTALIPVIFGAILLALHKGVKKEDKIIAHIAVLLTLLILVGLIKPLTAAIAHNASPAILRVSVMILTSAMALVFFIKSFIDIRRARKAANG